AARGLKLEATSTVTSSSTAAIVCKRPFFRNTVLHAARDCEHILQLLNHLMTTPLQWSDRLHRVGMVSVPIKAVLDWPMGGTASGFAFFLDPEVNPRLKKVLDAWGEYFRSGKSAKQALNNSPNAWFSADGAADLTTVTNGAVGTSHTFEDIRVQPIKALPWLHVLGRVLHAQLHRDRAPASCAQRRQRHRERERVEGL
ncbi:hypothetical protein EVJ58_g3224, partial [Rhodofomes roseus]